MQKKKKEESGDQVDMRREKKKNQYERRIEGTIYRGVANLLGLSALASSEKTKLKTGTVRKKSLPSSARRTFLL